MTVKSIFQGCILICASSFLCLSGTEKLYAYLKKYNIQLDARFRSAIGTRQRKPWKKFIKSKNNKLAVPEAIDLLDKLLR